MKLHELKKMVKEEFDKFVSEEDEGGEVDIAVDEPEEGGEEDVLRQIYDLLAAHFEGGEEEEFDAEDLGDEEGGEEEGGEEDLGDEEELEEASDVAYGSKGSPKEAKKSSGPNVGFKEGKGALQERFQKLANII
jgi:hypothetical protein